MSLKDFEEKLAQLKVHKCNNDLKREIPLTKEEERLIAHHRKLLEPLNKPLDKNSKNVGTHAKKFITLLEQAKQAGAEVEEVVTPGELLDVLFSLLHKGTHKRPHHELSEVFAAIYKATGLSKRYHRCIFVCFVMWEPLIAHGGILKLPDIQFLEGVMAFISVITQVSIEGSFEQSAYHVAVSDGEYFVITRYTKGNVIYKIIERLYEFQKKGFNASKTVMNLDYQRVLCGFFDEEIRSELWMHPVNEPVDLVVILICTLIRLPLLVSPLFGDAKTMDLFMLMLQDEKCKHMHSMLMYTLDHVLRNCERLNTLMINFYMNACDFKVILSIAMKDDYEFERLRRYAQRIVITTIRLRDNKEKDSLSFFPSRKVLTSVNFSHLQEFLGCENLSDRSFAQVLMGEFLEKEDMRDFAIEQGVPMLVVSTLRDSAAVNIQNDVHSKFINSALMVLMKLAHASKDRQASLLRFNTIKITSSYLRNHHEETRYLAKSTLLNLSGRILDAQLELFKCINLKDLVSEARTFHRDFINEQKTKEQYLKMMHVNIALFKQELYVNYHLTKGDESDNTYINLSNHTADKMMEIISYCILDNKKTLTPTFMLLSIPSMIYLLKMECISIDKWLTEDLVGLVLAICTDPSNSHFFKECESFQDVMERKYPGLISKSTEATIELPDPISDKKYGTKCSWPPCLNYGPSKETRSLGIVRKALKKCGHCYQVAYCGISCQRLHWKQHKKVCREESNKSVKKAEKIRQISNVEC